MSTAVSNVNSKKTVKAPKVGMVSLGCPKALVDSERILSQLRSEGYEISGTLSVTSGKIELNGEIPWTLSFFKRKIEKTLITHAKALLK